MKRQYRNDMSDSQKQAISNALVGRKHSEEHKRKIARALEKYWAQLPNKPDNSANSNTSEKVYEKDCN